MKMKSILLSMLAVATLASCSREEIPNEAENGENAYLGLNITLPAGSFSKAADANDANAETTEVNVKTVSVYTQSLMGGALTKSADLGPSDFDKAGNVYTLKVGSELKAVGTVDDKVNVYVVLNDATDMRTMLAGSPSTAPTAYEKGVVATAAKDNFLFANADPVTATLKSTAAEAIATGAKAAVTVERAVAKVMVRAAATFDITKNIPDLGATGTFAPATLKWVLGNSPKSLYVSRYTANGVVKSPDYKYVAGKDFSFFNSNYDVICDKDGKLNVGVTTVPVAPATGFATGYDGATSYVAYSNENTHDTYVVGNTTYILVMAQFTPTAIFGTLVGKGQSMTGIDGGTPAAGTEFYYHFPTKKYVTTTAYTAYVAVTGAGGVDEVANFVGPYTNGMCYYRIPVWDTKSGVIGKDKGTERNTFYTLAINSITAPGSPVDPTYPDPNKPNEGVDLNIGVDITVANWVEKDMGASDLK